jgi:hypothetical protein
MQYIIAIWNTEGRNCLNACNRNWLKDLAKEIPEAKWEIICTHNYPYPSAIISTEETPGLNERRKLPNDLLCQIPQDSQDKNSTLDPFQSSNTMNQNSFSPNLIHKVQD